MKLYQLAVRLGIAPRVLRDRLRAVGWDYDSVDAEVTPAAMSAVDDRWPRRVVGADGTAMCPCCRLPQRLEQDQFGVTETYCRSCQQHLGEDPVSRLQQHASHEEMLRGRSSLPVQCRSHRRWHPTSARGLDHGALRATERSVADRVEQATAVPNNFNLFAESLKPTT
jgi:hypothetical protein